MAAERVIRVKILVEAPGAAAAGNEAAGALDNTATSADNAGKKSSAAGKLIGLAIVAGAALATKAMLSLGMAYESSLNSLQAVTGATALQMAQVSEAAKALGNDISIPGASASDAAEAMTELAKGGLDVTEAMTAARGTLQLAAAAQINGAQAATIQADSLNAFHLEASEAGRVADVLANAANAATGEISDFGQGLAQSSAVAYSMGVSLEDNVTALGLFANAGVKGSDAGTSLKTMLQSLQNPTMKAQKALDDLGVTVYDAQGNFVGMRSVTDDLSQAKKRMSQEDFNAAASTVFGSDAVRAAQIIAEGGTAAWDDMSTALGKVGGAADLAAANSKGLKGAIDTVKNSVETAALTLYEQLSPSLETAVRGFSGLIDGLAAGLVPALADAGGSILDLGLALQPLIPALVDALVPAISAVAAILVSLTPIVVPLVEVLGNLLGWFAQLPEPVIAAAAAFTLLAASGLLTKVVVGIQGIIAAASGGVGAITALGAAMGAFFTSPAGIAILAAAALAAAIGFLVSSNNDAEEATKSYTESVDSVISSLNQQSAAVTNSTRTWAANKIGTDVLASYTDMGLNVNLMLDAIMGVPGAAKTSEAAIVSLAGKAVAANPEWQASAQGLRDIGISAKEFGAALLNQDFSQVNAAIDAYNESLAEGQPLMEHVNADMGIWQGVAMEGAAATDALRGAYETQNGVTQLVIDGQGKLKATTDLTTGAAVEYSHRIKDMDQAMQPLVATLEKTGEGIDGAAESASKSGPSFDDMEAAIKGTKEASDAAETAINYMVLAMDAAAGRAPDVERTQRAAAGAIRDATAAIRDQPASLRAVEEAQQKVNDITAKGTDENYSAEQKSRDLADAQDDLASAQDGVAAASDGQFEANQKLLPAMVTLATNAYNAAVQNGNLSGATQAAANAASTYRQNFIDAAIASGYTADEANRLADELGLIPDTVSTQVDMVDNTRGVRQVIQDFITAKDGSRITIYTDMITRQSTTTSNPKATEQANGGIMPFLNGGTLQGSYIAAANGLMRGVSAKVKGGDNGAGVLWGEPQVGYEWYISGKQGQERRNESFLANAASFFGGSYTPAGAQDVAPPSGLQFANGGGTTYVRSPDVNMGGTTVIVEIDGQQLQGRIVRTIEAASAADSRAVRNR